MGRLQGLTDIHHLAALKHRDFRNMWLAGMFSGAALWTFVAAISWLVLKQSNSSGWVGLVMFSLMLPFLIVSPIAGYVADRFDRRNMALTTFALGAVVAVVLAGLALFGALELWLVAVIAFAAGSLRAAQEPAIQALVPNQVPREQLLNAITLSATTRHGPRVLGLLVGAPLLAVDSVGVNGVLVISAAFQAIGVVFMLRTHTVSRGEAGADQGVLRSMVGGLAYIYSHRAIAIFIILVAFHCSLVMSFESILPVLSRDRLGATDGSVLGYLVMGFGAGALLGTLAIAGVRSERRKGELVLVTGLASGITPVLLALSGSVPVAALFAFGMGASQATFMALSNTYIQSVAPDRMRGRIASLYVLHAGGVTAFANLGYGFVADVYSAPPVFIVTGLLFIVVMLALGVTQPMLRRVYRTGQLAAA